MVTHEIEIDASPELVWSVTQDLERWPEWTPTVTSVTRLDSGPVRLGSIARLKQPLQPASDWEVTEFIPGRQFAWMTHRLGLRMTGRHEIFPERAGTRNVLTVEAEGVFAMLLWPFLRLATRQALVKENRGLKTQCERLSKSESV